MTSPSVPDELAPATAQRLRELAERYAAPLPQLTAELSILAARVDRQLKKMDATWT